jgi:alkaline phosphatase D
MKEIQPKNLFWHYLSRNHSKSTMNPGVFLFLLTLCVLFSCQTKEAQVELNPISTIAFGSCGHQNDPQPVLERVAELKPDLFIYLGDNIYSDTYSMDTLKLNYRMLGEKPEFQKLKSSTNIIATWDDHDFGWNDSGRHYPHKEASKEIFLDFFGVTDSTVLQHSGIYYSKIYPGTKKVQIIMLDTRTFRDKLLPYNGNRRGDSLYNYQLDYSPYISADSTMLGERQWSWLEEQLKQPADLRIIGSSVQFGITHNGYEAWANFPHEQKRMLELIKKTKAEGVLFISGDVHYAEISRITQPDCYPIYDVTASGITSTWGFATPNENRIDGPVMENHFGLLTIDWSAQDPLITTQIRNNRGETKIDRKIRLGDLRFVK